MRTIESFFIHWKTSLFGIAAGAFNSLAHGTAPKQVALSVALALLGLFSHDGTNVPVQ